MDSMLPLLRRFANGYPTKVIFDVPIILKLQNLNLCRRLEQLMNITFAIWSVSDYPRQYAENVTGGLSCFSQEIWTEAILNS